MRAKRLHLQIFMLALTGIFLGVGFTFGWWLGVAAMCAAWILAPERSL